MSLILETMDRYHWAMAEFSDPRTESWFLMSSPLPTCLIVLLYVILVVKGQQWMERREAFELKKAMLVYNFGLVLLSCYMLYEFVVSAWLQAGFSLICQPVEYNNHPMAHMLASACWWYYFSKIIELMDTFFFVLRKKNNQISFLHVYHHSTMPLLWWIGVRFVPGGEAYFSASVNSFVHVVMYTYYLLAAMGPHMQKYLWWKKYMTKLQLMQFFAVEFHTLYSIYSDCSYPKSYQWALIAYTMSHILLFSNFYYHCYMKNTKARHMKKDSNGLTNGVHCNNGTANGFLHNNGMTRSSSPLKEE